MLAGLPVPAILVAVAGSGSTPASGSGGTEAADQAGGHGEGGDGGQDYEDGAEGTGLVVMGRSCGVGVRVHHRRRRRGEGRHPRHCSPAR